MCIRLPPKTVGTHLRRHEGQLLLNVSKRIPLTTHSTVAKAALIYGLKAMDSDPEMAARLVHDELGKRLGTIDTPQDCSSLGPNHERDGLDE